MPLSVLIPAPVRTRGRREDDITSMRRRSESGEGAPCFGTKESGGGEGEKDAGGGG